jgi:hypothetical protein
VRDDRRDERRQSAYLPDTPATRVYGADPRIVTGGVFAPRGTAVPEQDGYRVAGRWPFASGSEHCAWLMGGCLVRGTGAPQARMMLFPATDARIVDTWNVAGLRGTGSHDMTVDDVFVPADRSVSIVTDRPRAQGTLYAFPVFGLLALGIAAVALGIARAAIDELVRLAREKSPYGSKRTLAERGVVQAELAQAEALVRSGRAFLHEAIERAWTAAEHDGTITTAERASLRLAATHATTSAAKATDLAYNAGGGTSIYASSPLQRCFRVVHVATQHAMVAGSTSTRGPRPLGPRRTSRSYEDLHDARDRTRRRRATRDDCAPDEPGERRRRCAPPRSHAALLRSPPRRARARRPAHGPRPRLLGGGRLRMVPEAAGPRPHGSAPPRREAAHLGPARRRDPDRRRRERPCDGPRR